jgi:hypothetical protein
MRAPGWDSDDNYDRERDLDRNFEREGGYGSPRSIPLTIGGAARSAHLAGELQPPVKIGGGR